MYRSISIITSIVISCFLSCSQGQPIYEVESIREADTCRYDSNHSYEIYLPPRLNEEEKLPLLIIIDPHGSGAHALNMFKYAANKYSVALVASNYIENGCSDYIKAISDLQADVKNKYPVNEVTFLTGFSGGARMALDYAQRTKVYGVISCGALASENQIRSIGSTVYSISGTDDFNFVETAQYLFNETTIPSNLKIELTNASHSWPDSMVLASAVAFQLLSSKSESIPDRVRENKNDFINTQVHKIDSCIIANKHINAWLIARNMNKSSAFKQNNKFKELCSEIQTNEYFINEIQQLKSALQFEMNVRTSYTAALSEKDSEWWAGELRSIENKIANEPDKYKQDMYKRIKSFWGIACYSFCNRAVQAKNTEMLRKILSVYKMIEPNNPDAFYFSAFVPYWQGNMQETSMAIQEALRKGYSDEKKLKENFPELSN